MFIFMYNYNNVNFATNSKIMKKYIKKIKKNK